MSASGHSEQTRKAPTGDDTRRDEAQAGARPEGAPEQPTKMPKAGWVEILKRSFKQMKHDDVTDRAAALTYYGVLAIFPGVLVLVSVLGLLGHSTTQTILNNVGQLAPGAVRSFLSTVIGQVQGKAGAAGIAAIVGLLLALWSASGYVAAFMRASNAIYEVDEGRPIWKTAPVRLLTTLALVVMLLVSLILVVVTGPIASQVGRRSASATRPCSSGTSSSGRSCWSSSASCSRCSTPPRPNVKQPALPVGHSAAA